jgi:hypothetical protein
MKHDYNKLSFVLSDESDGRIVNWWNPVRSGDYGFDCETGRAYARQLVDVIRENENSCIALPHITRQMPRGDEMTGVEIGFLTGIAIAVI